MVSYVLKLFLEIWDMRKTDPDAALLMLMEQAFRGPAYEGVKTKDWQPHMRRVLQCLRENDLIEVKGVK